MYDPIQAIATPYQFWLMAEAIYEHGRCQRIKNIQDARSHISKDSKQSIKLKAIERVDTWVFGLFRVDYILKSTLPKESKPRYVVAFQGVKDVGHAIGAAIISRAPEGRIQGMSTIIRKWAFKYRDKGKIVAFTGHSRGGEYSAKCNPEMSLWRVTWNGHKAKRGDGHINFATKGDWLTSKVNALNAKGRYIRICDGGHALKDFKSRVHYASWMELAPHKVQFSALINLGIQISEMDFSKLSYFLNNKNFRTDSKQSTSKSKIALCSSSSMSSTDSSFNSFQYQKAIDSNWISHSASEINDGKFKFDDSHFILEGSYSPNELVSQYEGIAKAAYVDHQIAQQNARQISRELIALQKEKSNLEENDALSSEQKREKLNILQQEIEIKKQTLNTCKQYEEYSQELSEHYVGQVDKLNASLPAQIGDSKEKVKDSAKFADLIQEEFEKWSQEQNESHKSMEALIEGAEVIAPLLDGLLETHKFSTSIKAIEHVQTMYKNFDEVSFFFKQFNEAKQEHGGFLGAIEGMGGTVVTVSRLVLPAVSLVSAGIECYRLVQSLWADSDSSEERDSNIAVTKFMKKIIDTNAEEVKNQLTDMHTSTLDAIDKAHQSTREEIRALTGHLTQVADEMNNVLEDLKQCLDDTERKILHRLDNIHQSDFLNLVKTTKNHSSGPYTDLEVYMTTGYVESIDTWISRLLAKLNSEIVNMQQDYLNGFHIEQMQDLDLVLSILEGARTGEMPSYYTGLFACHTYGATIQVASLVLYEAKVEIFIKFVTKLLHDPRFVALKHELRKSILNTCNTFIKCGSQLVALQNEIPSLAEKLIKSKSDFCTKLLESKTSLQPVKILYETRAAEMRRNHSHRWPKKSKFVINNVANGKLVHVSRMRSHPYGHGIGQDITQLDRMREYLFACRAAESGGTICGATMQFIQDVFFNFTTNDGASDRHSEYVVNYVHAVEDNINRLTSDNTIRKLFECQSRISADDLEMSFKDKFTLKCLLPSNGFNMIDMIFANVILEYGFTKSDRSFKFKLDFAEDSIINANNLPKIPHCPNEELSDYYQKEADAVNAYYSFLKKRTGGQFHAALCELFGENCKKTEMVLPDKSIPQDDLPPLVFPKSFLKAHIGPHLNDDLVAQCLGQGIIVPTYRFERDEDAMCYKLNMQICFVNNHNSNFDLGRIELATFNNVILNAYRNIFTENSQMHVGQPDYKWFLLQVMYASAFTGLEEMPNKNSIDLQIGDRNGVLFSAPQLTPFIGIYKILEKNPCIRIDYNRDAFDINIASQVKEFVNNRDAFGIPNSIAGFLKPTRLIPGKDYVKVKKLLRSARVSSVTEWLEYKTLKKNYYLLEGVCSLFSSKGNTVIQKKIKDALDVPNPDSDSFFEQMAIKANDESQANSRKWALELYKRPDDIKLLQQVALAFNQDDDPSPYGLYQSIIAHPSKQSQSLLNNLISLYNLKDQISNE